MKQKFSFWFIAALMAVMFIMSGCQMNVDDDDSDIHDNRNLGTLHKETADEIFVLEEDQVTPGGIAIIGFRDADKLRAYLKGTLKRQAVSEREPSLTINKIGGKPVTRIARGAFAPSEDYPADITEVVKKVSLPESIVVLGENIFAGTAYVVEVDIPPQAVNNIKEHIKAEIKAETIAKRMEEIATDDPDEIAEARAKITAEVETEVDNSAEAAAYIEAAVMDTVVKAIADSAVRVTAPSVDPEKPIVGPKEAATPSTEDPPQKLEPTSPPDVPLLPPTLVPPAPAEPETPPPPSQPSTPSNPTPPYTPPDTTAPVLSGGGVGALETFEGNTAEITFITNEAGTYSYVALGAADPAPDAAEIRAANSGVHGSAKVLAGAAAVTVTGLTVNTPYKVYLVMVDARGNVSAMLETEAFTPQYTPAGQLAAYLGTGASGEGNTVTLTGDKTISTLTVPDSVSLVVNSGVTLTAASGTFTVAGTLTVNGTLAVSGGILAGTGTLNGNGQVILAGPGGAESIERQITPTSGLFTFSGTTDVSFGADSALSLANAIEYAGDGDRIEILGNIGNKETDTKGFHIYSIVEKAITVTQGASRPYTIYGSIYVYGDTNDAVTLSNLKIETLKIPYSGYTGELVKEKPFLSSIGGVADNLTITNCELSVSSTANSLVVDTTPKEQTPIYSGIKIIPLTNNPSYRFSDNTITGLKSPYKTTGITIGIAGSDVSNWADRYPAIQSNTAYTTNDLKVVDLIGNQDLFNDFFTTFASWNNTVTGFDNEAVIRNDQHASNKAEKVYYSNSSCYSYDGLKDALNWNASINDTTYQTEVYLGVNASVTGDLGISKVTTLIIEDSVTLAITGNLTAGENAKIQLRGSAAITFTDSGSSGLSGLGTYTYSGSAWTKD